MGGSDLYKNIELGGRSWAIKKLDALTASYYAHEGIGAYIPANFAQGMGISKTDEIKSFSKEEFLGIQRDFLSVVFENLPAGYAPVITKQGTYGVADIDHNAPLLQELLMHSIGHSLNGFFQEDHYASMSKAIVGLFPKDAPTSETNGSISQSLEDSGNSGNCPTAHTP